MKRNPGLVMTVFVSKQLRCSSFLVIVISASMSCDCDCLQGDVIVLEDSWHTQENVVIGQEAAVSSAGDELFALRIHRVLLPRRHRLPK